MTELITIAIIAVCFIVVLFAFVNEMMKKDNEILAWQKAYTELAIENELLKLGVMK